MSDYFQETKYCMEDNIFGKSKALNPLVQLIAVVPPCCHKILPLKYGEIMNCKNSPIIDMFPTNIFLDMLYKESFHKCIALVPNINIYRLENAIKNIELTIEEKNRNKILENIIVSYRKK